MSQVSGHRPATAKKVVDALLKSRDLSTIVQDLNPTTLHHLVTELGIEDAAPLVAHASPRQIVELLDSTLWTGARPGDPETMSMEMLMRWFDLWSDMGDQAAAEILHDLGSEFCALALSRLIQVTDDPAGLEGTDEQCQILGIYCVCARYADEWDSVQKVLNALWGEYPDFLESILERLILRHSILRIEGELDGLRLLRIDAEFEREQSRERSGYVTSAMAGAYLQTVMHAELEMLVGEAAYDPETAAYFNRRTFLAQRSDTDPADRHAPEEDIEHTENRPTAGVEAEPVQGEGDSGTQAEFRAELAAYERAHTRNTLLLEGPHMTGLQQRQPVRAAIARLQDRPPAFAARMDELAYLANLLVAGTELDSRRLTETEAANLAMASCNLGGTYLHWQEASAESADAAIETWIAAEPGLIHLFRIGWHLISQLPLQAACQLRNQFRADAVRARFDDRTWLLEEVDALLGQPDFVNTVQTRKFEEAKETLRILSIVLAPEAVTALVLLIDSVPRFARILAQDSRGDWVSADARFIESFEDLARLQTFLRTLADRLRF